MSVLNTVNSGEPPHWFDVTGTDYTSQIPRFGNQKKHSYIVKNKMAPPGRIVKCFEDKILFNRDYLPEWIIFGGLDIKNRIPGMILHRYGWCFSL